MKLKIIAGLLLLNSPLYAAELRYSISLLSEENTQERYFPIDINDSNQILLRSPQGANSEGKIHYFVSEEVAGKRTITQLDLSTGIYDAKKAILNNNGIIMVQTGKASDRNTFVITKVGGKWSSPVDITAEVSPSFRLSHSNDEDQFFGFISPSSNTGQFEAIILNKEENGLWEKDNVDLPSEINGRQVKYFTPLNINNKEQLLLEVTFNNTEKKETFLFTLSGSEWVGQKMGDLGDNIHTTKWSKNGTQRVGWKRMAAYNPTFVTHAFLSTKTNNAWATQNLIAPSSEYVRHVSRSSFITNDGLIVGSVRATKHSNIIYPAMFAENEVFKLHDLITENSHNWELSEWVTDVNENGQIIGHGEYKGEFRSYLLTPIPQDGGLTPITPPGEEKEPVTCDIEVDPIKIKQGEEAYISWWSEYATSATLTPSISSLAGVIPTDTDGLKDQAVLVYPEKTTTYTLNVKGANGSASCQTTVVVEGVYTPLPECELGVDPVQIKKGEEIDLWWWTESTQSISIDNNIGKIIKPEHYLLLTPEKTTTYKMDVIGKDGSAVSCQTTVKVEGIYHPLPECEIGFDPEVISKGEETALWWWTESAKTIIIDNEVGSVSNYEGYLPMLFPTKNTTYKMKTVGEDGSVVSCQATVIVKP